MSSRRIKPDLKAAFPSAVRGSKSFGTGVSGGSERIAWIDAAKGIGIVLVVWGHAIVDTDSTLAVLLWSFHMPLFFFLSGTTATFGASMSRPALVRSATSLAIPYVFFSLVAIALWLADAGRLTSLPDWRRLLGEMAYGVSGEARLMSYDTALWFFTCLASVRLLFIGITRITQHEGRIAATVLAMAVCAHVAFALGLPRWPWNLDVALVAMVFHFAGHRARSGLRTLASVGPKTWPALLPAALAALLAMAAMARLDGRVDMNGRVFGTPPLFYACAFLGIFVTLVAAWSVKENRLLQGLGRASIVIFPVQLLLALVLPRHTFNTVYWYGLKLFSAPAVASLCVAAAQIVLCVPVYLAMARWTPELIGQRRRGARR